MGMTMTVAEDSKMNVKLFGGLYLRIAWRDSRLEHWLRGANHLQQQAVPEPKAAHRNGSHPRST